MSHICSPLHRDRKQNPRTIDCALDFSGGWWYNACTSAHLTGQHNIKPSKIKYNHKKIFYKYGGERGTTYNSWAEVEMLLLPNWAFAPSTFLTWSFYGHCGNGELKHLNKCNNYEYKITGGAIWIEVGLIPCCPKIALSYIGNIFGKYSYHTLPCALSIVIPWNKSYY